MATITYVHGASGSGKTMIARAIAGRTEATFFEEITEGVANFAIRGIEADTNNGADVYVTSVDYIESIAEIADYIIETKENK